MKKAISLFLLTSIILVHGFILISCLNLMELTNKKNKINSLFVSTFITQPMIQDAGQNRETTENSQGANSSWSKNLTLFKFTL